LEQASKGEAESSSVNGSTLTIEHVAVFMSVNRSTIERLLQNRKLSYYQVGAEDLTEDIYEITYRCLRGRQIWICSRYNQRERCH
jgi:excisionase family DNA binding protein